MLFLLNYTLMCFIALRHDETSAHVFTAYFHGSTYTSMNVWFLVKDVWVKTCLGHIEIIFCIYKTSLVLGLVHYYILFRIKLK